MATEYKLAAKPENWRHRSLSLTNVLWSSFSEHLKFKLTYNEYLRLDQNIYRHFIIFKNDRRHMTVKRSLVCQTKDWRYLLWNDQQFMLYINLSESKSHIYSPSLHKYRHLLNIYWYINIYISMGKLTELKTD